MVLLLGITYYYYKKGSRLLIKNEVKPATDTEIKIETLLCFIIEVEFIVIKGMTRGTYISHENKRYSVIIFRMLFYPSNVLGLLQGDHQSIPCFKHIEFKDPSMLNSWRIAGFFELEGGKPLIQNID